MKKIARLFTAIILASCLVVSIFMKTGDASSLSQSEIKQLNRSIHLSAAYLFEQIKSDGSFEYRRHIEPRVKLNKRYNMLRHAGTIYALASYSKILNDERILEGVGRAVDYLRKTSLRPVGDRKDMLAVWSIPEITGSRKPLTAKLGGAGLALVAMSACQMVNCADISDEELRKIGGFILFMQRDDGSFFSKFTPSEGGKRGDWVSLYYPGEAALGLIMLYEITGEKIWLQRGYKALYRLAADRRFSETVPADHWALLASERIWPHISADKQAPLAIHARQIVEHILNEQVVSENPLLDGGFTLEGRTTPTATRLEGLLAAYAIFSKDEQLKRDIENAVMIGTDFLISAQIEDGPLTGGVPRGMQEVDNPQTESDNIFNKRLGEVRIDYVQHTLSALLQFKSAFMNQEQ